MTSTFNVVNIIDQKSYGKVLTSEDIRNFIDCVYKKEVDDAQIGAFLMAVKINGMDAQEIADLTKCMATCSERFEWSEYAWKDKVVDKHSTGGVGDKISLILAPILAALGFKIPMISGRGLGITGGTIDKLESIDGYSCAIKLADASKLLNEVGFFIVGQTEHMVPVDKRLYAIRDVTATVASNALITASILSKKKIEDLQMLLMDIKYGKGAFMKNVEQAEKLANTMISTGKALGLKIVCLIDDMNSPLGYCIGNALEIAETLSSLNGHIPHDIKEILSTMVYEIMKSHNGAVTEKEAEAKMMEAVNSGKALERLKLMLIAQGVNEYLADNLCKQKQRTIDEYMEIMNQKGTTKTTIVSKRSGYICQIDSEVIGVFVRNLKGGRLMKDDKIDYAVGMVLCHKEGDQINENDPLATIYHRSNLPKGTNEIIQEAFTIHGQAPKKVPRIFKSLS